MSHPRTSADRPELPRRWGRWLGRSLFALLLVGLPVVGLAGMTVLGVRSYGVEESWVGQWIRDRYDPGHWVGGGRLNLDIVILSTRGVLSVEVDRTVSGERIDDSNRDQANLAGRTGGFACPDPGGSGWGTVEHAIHQPGSRNSISEELADLPGLCGVEDRLAYSNADEPGNLIGLPRDDGALRPLSYFAWASDYDLADHDRIQVVGPVWGWMLSLVVPIVWWLWCPSGWVVPRITLRRAIGVVAGAGVALGLVHRSPATDRAVLTFREFGVERFYSAEPTAPARPVLTGVGLCLQQMHERVNGLMPTDAARFRQALADSPGLRYLALRGVVGYDGIEADILAPSLPELACLDLRESSVDDAALARLADFPSLERLALTRSRRITDAGLAHLRHLPHLTHLWLGDLAITEAGLDHLQRLPHLQYLSFEPSTIAPPWFDPLAPTALQRLADSLPNLEELVCPDGTILRPQALLDPHAP